MKTLEDDLKSQERRSLPPAWKDEILANAALTNAALTVAWLFPNWLRLGLAALWIVTLTLHAAVPHNHEPHSPTSPNQWLGAQNRFDQLSIILAYEDATNEHSLTP